MKFFLTLLLNLYIVCLFGQDSTKLVIKKDSLPFQKVHTFGFQTNYNNILTIRTLYSNTCTYGIKTKYFTSIHHLSLVNVKQERGINWQHEIYTIPINKIYYHLFYSTATLRYLARFSAGANLFINAGKGWEPNAGYRYMSFGKDANAHIVNMGLGKYYKAYLFNYRLYLVPAAGSLTHTVSVRRYFKDVHYIETGAGYGSTISESVLQNNAGRVTKASFISVGAKIRITPSFTCNMNAGLENFKTSNGRASQVVNLGLGVNYQIKNAKKTKI